MWYFSTSLAFLKQMQHNKRMVFDKYDQITKAAFDSTHVLQVETEGDPPSFEAGVVNILRQGGVPEQYLAGLGGEPVGSDAWLDAFRGVVYKAEDVVVDTAIGGVLAAIAPASVLVAFEGGMAKLRQSWASATEKSRQEKRGKMHPGSWVYINNGQEPGQVGHDELRRRLVEKPQPEDNVSIGFYIALAAGLRVAVFNFRLFREEHVLIDDVFLVDGFKARELDDNPLLSSIRDLKFVEPPQPKLDHNVPTDPGTEVILNEELYHIVQCEGSMALIEDEHGQRFTVSIEKLTRGRVKHNNVWNYQTGKPFLTGFESGSPAPCFAGQWVWVAARAEIAETGAAMHELAVVWKLEADGVHVVLAVDGVVRTFSEGTFRPVTDDLVELMSLRKIFNIFRREVLEGGDTKTHNLGQYELLFCLGKVNEEQIKFVPGFPKGDPVIAAGLHKEPTVGDGGRAAAEDAKNEISKATGIPPGDVDPGHSETQEAVDNGPDEGLWGYGVMLALGLFLYNSVDVNIDILAF